MAHGTTHPADALLRRGCSARSGADGALSGTLGCLRALLPAPLLAALLPVLLLALLLVGAAAAPASAQQAPAREEPLPGAPPATETAPPAAPGTLEQAGQSAAEVARRVESRLEGQVITVGAGYGRTDFRLTRDRKFSDGATPQANLTDNGELVLLLRYNTAESYLLDVPMREGRFRVGYNFVTRLSRFRTELQEVGNSVLGENLGTVASGTVLAAAPVAFMLIGPLHEGGKLFWKAGFGLGAALIDFEADALFRNNRSDETSRERVSQHPRNLNVYVHTFWTLEWENWTLLFLNDDIRGNIGIGSVLYKANSLSVGYRFVF
jgi:hypothetical protein